MSRLTFQLAILPAVFLIWYIYRKDAVEQEPPKLLAQLFGFGALIAIVAIVLELAAEVVLRILFPAGSLPYVFFENFYGIALIEEGCKYVVLRKRTWKSPHFDYLFDGVVYAVLVSLGFATIENLGYVAGGGISTAIARALLSVPGHAIFGVCMGYFYGLAKRADLKGHESTRGTNLLLALVAPTILHGTYDFLISIEMFGVFLVFEIAAMVLAVKRVDALSKGDEPL